MKRRILILASLSMLLILASCAYAYDNGDFQIWNTEVEEAKINEKLAVALEEEFRFGDDANDLYYHHYDLGFIWSLNKNLDLGLNYRQVYEKKNGKFREENRPHINATVKHVLFGLNISDRSRLQYRHFDYQTDFWQYRNKFTIKPPWKFTKIGIQPYLSDEAFINFYGASFTRNRFYSGINFDISKNIRAEVYYLLQHTRTVNNNSVNWPHINALGTKLKILF